MQIYKKEMSNEKDFKMELKSFKRFSSNNHWGDTYF